MCEFCDDDYDDDGGVLASLMLADIAKMRQQMLDKDLWAQNDDGKRRAEFSFVIEDAVDHFVIDDSTQFPASRINKPVNFTVVNEMIAARLSVPRSSPMN